MLTDACLAYLPSVKGSKDKSGLGKLVVLLLSSPGTWSFSSCLLEGLLWGSLPFLPLPAPAECESPLSSKALFHPENAPRGGMGLAGGVRLGCAAQIPGLCRTWPLRVGLLTPPQPAPIFISASPHSPGPLFLCVPRFRCKLKPFNVGRTVPGTVQAVNKHLLNR